MFKKSLAFFSGLLVTLVVFAAGAQLRHDHPDKYVVVRGDTLWDISAKFLDKPWLWPEIWRANPQVENPHLIYPGDVLDLSYLGGPHLTLKPRVRKTPLGDAIPPVPLELIEPFLKDLRVVDAEMLKQAPYVMAIEENRLRGTTGQFVYARGDLSAAPGQKLAIVRPTHSYHLYDADNEDREITGHQLYSNAPMVHGPWKEYSGEDGRWGDGEVLGVEIEVIGTAEFMQDGDPATLLVVESGMEIRAGDRVLPANELPYDAAYYPHAPANIPDNARVIAFADAMNVTGPLQVVALSAGASDGIDNGSTFSIFQPGQRIEDPVDDDFFRDDVTLPELFVGHVMVFRTFDHVSYGLIMDGIRPVHMGDTLRAPE